MGNKILLDLFKPREQRSFVLTYIKNKCLKYDQNFLGLLTGGTGTGKSSCALRMCEELDEFFNSDRILFSVKDFAKKMAERDYPAGSCFILEEAQQSVHNLNFWSSTNKGFFYILSTFRHKNYCVFLTLPSEVSLDSQARRLFHGIFRTTGHIDRKRNLCLVDVSFPKQHAYKKDVVFPMKLDIMTGEGIRRCSKMMISKPSNELWRAYTRKKEDYTRRLNKNIADVIADPLVAALKQTKNALK